MLGMNAALTCLVLILAIVAITWMVISIAGEIGATRRSYHEERKVKHQADQVRIEAVERRAVEMKIQRDQEGSAY
jgi:hypothetical protein